MNGLHSGSGRPSPRVMERRSSSFSLARARPADVVLDEDLPDCLGTRASGVAGELVVDGIEVEYLEGVGLVEGPFELAVGDDLGEVEEGAVEARARDVVHPGYVSFGEGGRAMDGDSWVAAGRTRRDRHFDLAVAPVAELVEDRRRAVGQDGARAAGEDGGHVQALALEERLGDEGVDGLVDAVEAADVGSCVDSVVGEPELAQLLEPEHAVLRERELGQGLVEKTVVRGFLDQALTWPHASRKPVTCLQRGVPIHPRVASLKPCANT
jgi:hypothetical protein